LNQCLQESTLFNKKSDLFNIKNRIFKKNKPILKLTTTDKSVFHYYNNLKLNKKLLAFYMKTRFSIFEEIILRDLISKIFLKSYMFYIRPKIYIKMNMVNSRQKQANYCYLFNSGRILDYNTLYEDLTKNSSTAKSFQKLIKTNIFKYNKYHLNIYAIREMDIF
jgi:hypothetical protein